MKVSIVLPVYNEEENLRHLHERLTAATSGWEVPDLELEIVLVNDGSQDRSLDLIRELRAADPRVKYLSFSRNFGHQAAVSAGVRYAAGDCVFVMDSDLQDPPEVLGEMLAKWREGHDVVYAVRQNRKESFLKRLGYRIFYRLLRRISSISIPVDAGDFCVMDRRVVDVVNSLPERNRFMRGLRTWAGFRHCGVTYDRPARHAGQAKYGMRHLLRLASLGILSFSDFPLKLASFFGLVLCGFSGILLVLLLVWYGTGVELWGMQPKDVAGWTSIVALVIGMAGAQMLILGVIGEYLAQMFTEIKGRPAWIISDADGIDGAAGQYCGWHAGRAGRPGGPGPDGGRGGGG